MPGLSDLPLPLGAARALAPVTAGRTTVSGCLHRWSTASQQRARRNAMVASTALAQRRAEREEVEEFLAALAPRHTWAAPGAPDPRTAHA